MEHVSNGTRNDGNNGAGLGRNVQGNDAVSAIILQRDLVGACRDAQGPDGVPPSGSTTDHRDYVETRGRRKVAVPIGRGDDGSRRAPPHWGVHKELVKKNSVEDGLSPRLCTVHRVRAVYKDTVKEPK